MNEVRRIESEADEVAAIRAVVDRHAAPSFVSGFDVSLGMADDEPAAWIVFSTTGARPQTLEGRKHVAELLNSFVRVVHYDLRETVRGRYPFFRFRDPTPAVPTET